VPVSQTAIEAASDLRVICERVVRCVSSQIADGMRSTFDADFCLRTRLHRPSHDQRRAVLDGSTYVMADEARPHFCVDRMCQQSYREDLADATGHPSALSPDAER
jgi:hypothetical protein